MKHESGRVVVITGASSGIGKATALRFAKNGDRLVLAARRKNLLKELVNEVEELGAEAIAVETDASQERSVEKLAQVAGKKFGRIDVWFNNAGVGAMGRFDEVPLEDHEQVIDTNLLGTLYGSYFALRQFRKQGDGILINMSSVVGKITQPWVASYTASKHGIRALSGSLRQELWLDDLEDIHVCTVFPEGVDTPFFQHEANYTGYKIQAPPPVETPEHAADIVFQLSIEPQDEVHVGKAGKFMAAQQKIARGTTEKQMAWMTKRGHVDRSTHEAPSSKSIHEPDTSEEGAIRGGWKNGSGSASKPLKLIGMVAPAVLGIYFLAKGRKSEEFERAA
jgi:short-subunit dehydrogenase